MSAADHFMRGGIDREDVPDVVPGEVTKLAEPREPIDLDKVQVVAWSVVGVALYLGFAIASAVALTLAFGAWVGCLVGLLAGTLPAGYSLVKAHQRTAAREKRAHQAVFRGEAPSASAFDIPNRP